MLINCSECGERVSDKAPMCPHCGNPLKGAAAHGGGILGWFRAKKYERQELRQKQIVEERTKSLSDGTAFFQNPFDVTYYHRRSGTAKVSYIIEGAESFYESSLSRTCDSIIVSYEEAMALLLPWLIEYEKCYKIVGTVLYLAYLHHDDSSIEKIKSGKAYARRGLWQGHFLERFFDKFDSDSFLDFYEAYVGDAMLKNSCVQMILSNVIGRAIVRRDTKLIAWWSARGLVFEIGEYGYEVRSRTCGSFGSFGTKTTPLATAVENDDLEEAAYLLSYHADPNVYMGFYSSGECDPMIEHIKSVSMLKLLLENGLDLHIPSRKPYQGSAGEDGSPVDLFWSKLTLPSSEFSKNAPILDYLESIGEDRRYHSKFFPAAKWFADEDYSMDGFKRTVDQLNERSPSQGAYMERWFRRACKKYGAPEWFQP
jgi:hypothetical protein